MTQQEWRYFLKREHPSEWTRFEHGYFRQVGDYLQVVSHRRTLPRGFRPLEDAFPVSMGIIFTYQFAVRVI